MKRSILRYARPVLIVTAVTTVIWVNAGSLTPPGGPVAPTMKALDQVEARTIVNATNTPGDGANSFIISAPGSYYLTGNITGTASKHGISIQANDVTLDLNGFALISGGGGVRGVNVPVAQSGFSIRNGSVRGWTGGGVRADTAVTLAEKLRLSDNVGAIGLAVGNGSMIKDCVASGNATGFFAPDRTQVSNCIATLNTGVGFDCQGTLAGLSPGEPGHKEESERCDRLTQLLDHGDPVPFAASWTGWKFLFVDPT